MFDKLIAFFKVPLAKEQAQTELEETERLLLKHDMQALYHSKMAEYCQECIPRLTKYNRGTVRG